MCVYVLTELGIMYARHNRKALAHLQRAHELLGFGMNLPPGSKYYELSDSDDDDYAEVIPGEEPTQKRDISKVNGKDNEDVLITRVIHGDKRARHEQPDHAEQSTSSSDTQILRPVLVQELRDAKVQVSGRVTNIPPAVKELISNCDFVNKAKILDVPPRGNCGDHVLAIVHFSIAEQSEALVTPNKIRERIFEYAKDDCGMPKRLWEEYKNSLYANPGKGVRFLEFSELALFCHSFKLNCFLFRHNEGSESVKDEYNSYYRRLHKDRPWAVVMNTGDGTHYELMIKQTNKQNGLKTEAYVLFSDDEVSSMMEGINQHNVKVQEIPVCELFRNDGRSLDALLGHENELLYMAQPSKGKGKRVQK